MMIPFLTWLMRQTDFLLLSDIAIEHVSVTETQAGSIHFMSDPCAGRVTVLETGELLLEVVRLETNTIVYQQTFAAQTIDVDYRSMLLPFFQAMQAGIVAA